MSGIIELEPVKFSISLKYMSCKTDGGTQWESHFSDVLKNQPGQVTHGLMLDNSLHLVGRKHPENDFLSRSFEVKRNTSIKKIVRSLAKEVSMADCLKILGSPNLEYSGNGNTFLWRLWISGGEDDNIPVFIMVAVDSSSPNTDDAELAEIWMWVGD